MFHYIRTGLANSMVTLGNPEMASVKRFQLHLLTPSHLWVPQTDRTVDEPSADAGSLCIADLLTLSHSQMSASHLLGLQGSQQTPGLSMFLEYEALTEALQKWMPRFLANSFLALNYVFNVQVWYICLHLIDLSKKIVHFVYSKLNLRPKNCFLEI